MGEMLNTLLSSICHRSGGHADVLPLCVRCSGVYAGVLLGLFFEIGLLARGRARPGRAAFVIGASGLALMAVVGLGRVYGLFATPEPVTLFTALYFGASVAFFAAASVAHELGPAQRVERRRAPARAVLLAALAAGALAVRLDWTPALHLLGLLASAGLAVTFLGVNFAFALVVLRGMKRVGRRLPAAASAGVALAAVEFLLFFLWRQT